MHYAVGCWLVCFDHLGQPQRVTRRAAYVSLQCHLLLVSGTVRPSFVKLATS